MTPGEVVVLRPRWASGALGALVRRAEALTGEGQRSGGPRRPRGADAVARRTASLLHRETGPDPRRRTVHRWPCYDPLMDDAVLPVTIDVPPEIARGAAPGALADEALRLLVLERFRRRELSAAQCARLLGIGRVPFLELCVAHGIPVIQYDPDDFRRELANIIGARG